MSSKLLDPEAVSNLNLLDQALKEMEKAGWPCRLVEAPAMIRSLEAKLASIKQEARGAVRGGDSACAAFVERLAEPTTVRK